MPYDHQHLRLDQENTSQTDDYLLDAPATQSRGQCVDSGSGSNSYEHGGRSSDAPFLVRRPSLRTSTHPVDSHPRLQHARNGAHCS